MKWIVDSLAYKHLVFMFHDFFQTPMSAPAKNDSVSILVTSVAAGSLVMLYTFLEHMVHKLMLLNGPDLADPYVIYNAFCVKFYRKPVPEKWTRTIVIEKKLEYGYIDPKLSLLENLDMVLSRNSDTPIYKHPLMNAYIIERRWFNNLQTPIRVTESEIFNEIRKKQEILALLWAKDNVNVNLQ